MASLAELTAQIITARATKKEMSTEEFQAEMKMVYIFLKGVEEGVAEPTGQTTESAPVKLNYKQFFKKAEIICMICNKGGFKTLKRHLSIAHDLKPAGYRKQFDIPTSHALVAKAYSEQRKKDALDRGQGEILAKARAGRAAKNAPAPVKAAPVAHTATETAPANAKAPAKVKAPAPAKPKATAKKLVAKKAPAKKPVSK